MHPVTPDPDSMLTVLRAAEGYRVDSFELCGDAHSSRGGLDGAIRFRDYPEAAEAIDEAAVADMIGRLREIAGLAHSSGRPIYYWHREVMVPRVIIESVPGLLDERGELDLLGQAYHALLRAKIAEFAENVPEIDGLVLTLTESDYSVIHNSDPDRYPPVQVVESIIRTFAHELKRLEKRFILRSFGSVPQDYEDILAGAEHASAQFPFEVETKITPYDFSPFLTCNPYLTRAGSSALSAEYDSIGEFLGAGYVPAPDPQRVIEWVRYATAQSVDRHVIRIDRIGHSTFDSPQAINLHAFARAIEDPSVTPDQVWHEWAALHWPRCADEMIEVTRRGIAMVKHSHFIDGHVIFHAFPIDPSMRWLKAAGIFSAFRPASSLTGHRGMWGILTGRTTPLRAEILKEKELAVQIADEGEAALVALCARLPAKEFEVMATAWRNAAVVTRQLRAWCACVCAYLDDLEGDRTEPSSLETAIAASFPAFSRHLETTQSEKPSKERGPGSGHEYGGHASWSGGIEAAYSRPIWQIIELLREEYRAELAERRRWQRQRNIGDFIVCGGIADDIRVRRYMHAGHAKLIGGRPARAAGNRVFPNGYLEFELVVPAAGSYTVIVEGDPQASRGFLIEAGAGNQLAIYDAAGRYAAARSGDGRSTLVIRLSKAGADYPWIYGIGVAAPSQ